MKKLFFSLFLSLSFFACDNDNSNLHIIGKVDGGFVNGDSLFLVSLRHDGSVDRIASCVVQDEAFELKGNVNLPAICNIVTYNKQGRVNRSIDVVADGKPISVTVLKDYARISGSPLNDELQNYMDSVSLVKGIYKRYYDKKAGTANLSDKAKDEADRVMQTTALFNRNLVYSAIQRNIDNIVGLYIIKNNFDIIEPEKGVEFIERLPANYRQDYLIAYMNRYYKAVIKNAVGAAYSDFVMQDNEGIERYLSHYVGRDKPVVVSIWSSNNKKSLADQLLLKQFASKSKGAVSFVGVSIDTNKNSWLSAIDSNGLTGVQLTDFRAWNSLALSVYGIDRCPYYLLIDKKGIITYRGTSCEDLVSVTEHLLKK